MVRHSFQLLRLKLIVRGGTNRFDSTVPIRNSWSPTPLIVTVTPAVGRSDSRTW